MTPSEALQAIRAVVEAQGKATPMPWVAAAIPVVRGPKGQFIADCIGATDGHDEDNLAFIALAGSTDWSAVLEALEGTILRAGPGGERG